MKTLSIRQPWASLIAGGFKPVENREWSTSFRGRFLIHASKTFDTEGYTWVCGNAPLLKLPFGFMQMKLSQFPMGGIVGEADLVGCCTHHNSPWFVGPYAFVIKNAKQLPFVAMPGRLKFFNVEDSLMAPKKKGAGKSAPAKKKKPMVFCFVSKMERDEQAPKKVAAIIWALAEDGSLLLEKRANELKEGQAAIGVLDERNDELFKKLDRYFLPFCDFPQLYGPHFVTLGQINHHSRTVSTSGCQPHKSPPAISCKILTIFGNPHYNYKFYIILI